MIRHNPPQCATSGTIRQIFNHFDSILTYRVKGCVCNSFHDLKINFSRFENRNRNNFIPKRFYCRKIVISAILSQKDFILEK